MTLSAETVGYQGSAFQHTVDARWSMAYSACLNDMTACYFDNADGNEITTHPLFPVCVEWPGIVESLHVNNIDMRNTVHATHDLHIHRLIQPTTELETSAVIIGIEQRKPGIYLGWRLDTRDKQGELVCQTYQGNLFLRSQLNGEGQWMEAMPATPVVETTASFSAESTIDVPANLGHTYTECARIWNPIHSDQATARAAGLNAPLLHGTASLALATSAVVNELLDQDPARVKRIGGRFSAMVMMPSSLTLKTRREKSTIFFELINSSQEAVISDGYVVI